MKDSYDAFYKKRLPEGFSAESVEKSKLNFQYRCSQCSESYPIEPVYTVCPGCSKQQEADQPIRGILEVVIQGSLDRDFNVMDMLPVEADYFPGIPVGNTPLWRPERLNAYNGFSHLFLKDDSLNPTGSLKDRASYLVSAFANKFTMKKVVVASTGNAGSSMAGVGAAAGLEVLLFLPETAPVAKMTQALQYGAKVVPVAGNYDLAFDLSMKYTAERGGLSRNTAYNPLTIEGKKTVALEIFKQLNAAPDIVFVPTGDGVILSGVYKGFRDLMGMGFIEKIPLIYAVQAEGSDAIARAFGSGKFEARATRTVADSICVDVPRNGVHALANLKKYGGQCVAVSDDAILEAQKELASLAGCFAEPAAAAAYAGFLAVKEDIDPALTVVLLITGNGLKDIQSAKKQIEVPKQSIKDLPQGL